MRRLLLCVSIMVAFAPPASAAPALAHAKGAAAGFYTGPLEFTKHQQRGTGIDGDCGFGSTGEKYVLKLRIKSKKGILRGLLTSGGEQLAAQKNSVRSKRRRLSAVFVVSSGYGITTRITVKLRQITATSAKVVQNNVSYRESPANSCLFGFSGTVSRL